VIIALDLIEITRQDPDGSIEAAVEGEHDTYQVRRTRTGVWSCTCPGWFYGRSGCSYGLAVQLLMKDDGAARQQAASQAARGGGDDA
jgi:uncharacterized Zn finger protein